MCSKPLVTLAFGSLFALGASLPLAAALASPGGDIWLVHSDSEFQDAVANSASGDTILVNNDSNYYFGGFDVAGKGITIKTLPGQPPLLIVTDIRIQDVPVGDTFHAAGLRLVWTPSIAGGNGLDVRVFDCDGSVTLERVSGFAGPVVVPPSSYGGAPGKFEISGSEHVVLTDCSLSGVSGSQSLYGTQPWEYWQQLPGSPVSVFDSDVWIYGCDFAGGNAYSLITSTSAMPQIGMPAIAAGGTSRLFVSESVLTAGTSVNCETGAAAAIEVDATSTLELIRRASTLVAGSNSCNLIVAPEVSAEDGTLVDTTSAAPTPSISVYDQVIAGDPLDVTAQAAPFQLMYLLPSFGMEASAFSSLDLHLGTFAPPIYLGFEDVTLSIGTPLMSPSIQACSVYLQVAAVDLATSEIGLSAPDLVSLR